MGTASRLGLCHRLYGSCCIDGARPIVMGLTCNSSSCLDCFWFCLSWYGSYKLSQEPSADAVDSIGDATDVPILRNLLSAKYLSAVYSMVYSSNTAMASHSTNQRTDVGHLECHNAWTCCILRSNDNRRAVFHNPPTNSIVLALKTSWQLPDQRSLTRCLLW